MKNPWDEWGSVFKVLVTCALPLLVKPFEIDGLPSDSGFAELEVTPIGGYAPVMGEIGLVVAGSVAQGFLFLPMHLVTTNERILGANN